MLENTEYIDDLLTHGYFEWGGRAIDGYGLDCLGLVKAARSVLCPNAPQIPDHSWVYKKYQRDELPPMLVLKLAQGVDGAEKVDIPQPGDVAVLDGARGMALGAFIGDYNGVTDGVLLFGSDDRPVLEPDFALPNLVGYWRLT